MPNKRGEILLTRLLHLVYSCTGSIQHFLGEKKRMQQSLQRLPAPKKRKQRCALDPSSSPSLPSPCTLYSLSHTPFFLPFHCSLQPAAAPSSPCFSGKRRRRVVRGSSPCDCSPCLPPCSFCSIYILLLLLLTFYPSPPPRCMHCCLCALTG